MDLARHDGKFEAAGEAQVELNELLVALSRRRSVQSGNRRDAIARCLSASEGWRKASDSLGGAFATLDGTTGLTGDKE